MWMTSSLWNAISSQVSMWSTCLCSIHPTNHWMVIGKIMTTELVCFGCSSCIFSYVLLAFQCLEFLFYHSHALVCAGTHLMLKLLVEYSLCWRCFIISYLSSYSGIVCTKMLQVDWWICPWLQHINHWLRYADSTGPWKGNRFDR